MLNTIVIISQSAIRNPQSAIRILLDTPPAAAYTDPMSRPPILDNTLFYGDNLPILREYVGDGSVDLIYLDPPFNANRSFNVLFRDAGGAGNDAQLLAFEDTWTWGPTAEATYHDLIGGGAPAAVGQMVGALRTFLGPNAMLAYLVMMAARLVELHRVLKPSGSLYLHCDPTASHYLKMVLDTIFGPQNFRNEIIWKRTGSHNSAKRWGPNHDVILFYSRSEIYTWNAHYIEHSQELLDSHYRNQDSDGRRYTLSDLTGRGLRSGSSGLPWRGFDPATKGNHWATTVEKLDEWDKQGRIYWPVKGGWPRYKRYLDEVAGSPIQEIWSDIDPLNAKASERLGYATQKPLALLERIIQASSNPGDWVLDPFCGCGTAIAAAQTLGRRWIGIDITHLSITLQRIRLEGMFPGLRYAVVGEPKDLAGAHHLAAADRYQFQWWALSLVRAQPVGGPAGGKTGKKGRDRGVDGLIPFVDDGTQPQQVIVQVKSGHVGPTDIRDLQGTLQTERAAIGVFLTLEPPSAPMQQAATAAGFYESKNWAQRYPAIQILTVADLLAGKGVQMPPRVLAFRQSAPAPAPDQQGRLALG